MMKKLFLNNIYTFLAIGLLGILLFYTTNHSRGLEGTFQTVTIEVGDSIWEIAKLYQDDGHEPTDFVNWVAKNNAIDINNIKPGQEVLIPIKKGSPNDIKLADAK